MSQRFGFSPSPDPDSTWFRIGRLSVTSTIFAVLVGVVGLVLDVLTAYRWSDTAALFPQSVFSGQVYRVVTWPLASNLSLNGIIALALLWYFGTRLEEDLLGKKRMAWLLLGTVVLLSAVALVVGLGFSGGVLAGLSEVELMVILLFIAEYPHVRFFFNIPAWVIGAVIVGLQVAQLLAARDMVGLGSFVLGLLLVAVLARSLGILTDYQWIPKIGVPKRGPRKPRGRGRLRAVPPSPPTAQDFGVRRHEPAPTKDQAALDALLDKISERGMDALSESEKKELLVLRDRLRNR